MELSIIIASFNNKDLLSGCLSSIYNAVEGHDYEVIVVDNDSNDKSAEMVQKEYPQARLIRNRTNKGFSKACNQGILLSGGRNILFLNNDTEILGDSLKAMTEFLDQHNGVGIIGAQMLSLEGKAYRSCFRFPNLLEQLFARKIFNSKIMDSCPISLIYPDWNSGKTIEVDWVSGAALMIKKEVIQQIGSFDEEFFFYFEDVDLCFRANQVGFKVCYLPQAKIIHGGQSSTRHDSGRFEIEWLKSRLRYFKKHHSRLVVVFIKFLMATGSIVRIVSLLVASLFAPGKCKGYKDAVSANSQLLALALKG